MTITAKIIAHSKGFSSPELITLQLRYPRFIHAEFMTHRVFSRNASSSRAVPVERLIQDILDDTAMPIHWGKNQKGMQADEECNTFVDCNTVEPMTGDPNMAERLYTRKRTTREDAWFEARDRAIEYAKDFSEAGYHKQIVNRLLEPFSHINVVVTATEWDNFFLLRDHKDAQPEIMILAQEIKKAIKSSTPRELKDGEWHLPYVNVEERAVELNLSKSNKESWDEYIKLMVKCSVARCARVSYVTHEFKTPTIKEDLALYERLVGSDPKHMSPAEHQATPDKLKISNALEYAHGADLIAGWSQPELHGNFKGWIQYRKTIE